MMCEGMAMQVREREEGTCGGERVREWGVKVRVRG